MQNVSTAGSAAQPSSKPGKIPGPDHPITITRSNSHVVVSVAGKVIADTRAALSLKESNYPVTLYIPLADVDMTLLEATTHTSYCPYKGDCSYYSIPVGGARANNAVWQYQAPYESVAAIKDYLAFYTDRVDAIKITPAL